ncbi:putative protein phosphatase 2C 48 [Prunus yedoensis var. nudiflora]|uniref:protein-serine/threonine phosphatase n=1 Tax=Prunus yedoensis var. nudiflora TaxID=2094558 RepID=A0A314ZKY6_PRUYE|nr:putative protein phosphatase 2C 48 [Prunus yedoensis var. nudiflora]
MGSCWKPSAVDDGPRRGGSEASGRVDGLLWYKDLGQHAWGEFSMAVIQANSVLEDQSQIESGPLSSTKSGPVGTFVGVYDGHGGPEASTYVNENLFCNLQRIAAEHRAISEHVIKKAYLATEENFLSMVKKKWLNKPQIASAGTCCLVGILCNGLLYTANVGDSRVVLGKIETATKEVIAVQLSTEHNASIESVRDELKSIHPYDPKIVVLRHNVWRVKGLIQVTRSLGDAYLKNAEFNREPLPLKFRLPEPFLKPILIPNRPYRNQEAVDIVNSYPRKGIARKLVEAALQEAAKKREVRYSDLRKIERGVRRHFHDDISVVVVFLSTRLKGGATPRRTQFSLKPNI